MKHFLQKYLFMFVCLILLSSCSSTKTTLDTAWSDSAYKMKIKKILIIGLSADSAGRRAFEDNMKKRLVKSGVNAVTSLDLHLSGKPNPKAIKQVVINQGIDAVLVSRLVAIDNKSEHVPGRVDYVATGPSRGFGGFNDGRYSNFYGYYPSAYRQVYTSGYLKNTKEIRIETNVYEAQQGKMVWSALSKTFDPISETDAINSLNSVISSKLIADGLFK